MNLLDQSAELPDFFVDPNIILQIRAAGLAKREKMIVFELPRGVGLLEDLDGFFGSSAREHAFANDQRARTPLAQTIDVRAAELAE